MTRYTIGLDDSVSGWSALEWADDRIDAAHDAVRLVTVDEFLGEPTARGADRLRAAAERLRRHHPGVHVTEEYIGGPTVDRLVEASSRSDLLVVGARRTNRLDAFLTGWITERTVAHSSTPIVVVPEQADRRDGAVLLAVDPATAGAAADFAAGRAESEGRELVLLRSWEVPVVTTPYGYAYIEEDRGIWQREAERDVEPAARRIRAALPGVRVRTIVQQGRPSTAIASASGGMSLIVLGRRHHTALGAAFFGSVAQELLHDCRVPICVVPQLTAAGRTDDPADYSTAVHALDDGEW